MGDLVQHLALGFSVAFSLQNLGLAFLGCLIGTLVGVLPGVGPIARFRTRRLIGSTSSSAR